MGGCIQKLCRSIPTTLSWYCSSGLCSEASHCYTGCTRCTLISEVGYCCGCANRERWIHPGCKKAHYLRDRTIRPLPVPNAHRCPAHSLAAFREPNRKWWEADWSFSSTLLLSKDTLCCPRAQANGCSPSSAAQIVPHYDPHRAPSGRCIVSVCFCSWFSPITSFQARA